VQVASGGPNRPGEKVEQIYREYRKLQADYLRQVRALQRSAGISEAEIRAIERARDKSQLPNCPDSMWRAELSQTDNVTDMDPMVRYAVERLTSLVDPTWLHQETQKPYRLDSAFLVNPLHLVNGVRVGMGIRNGGPQRFARMLLLAQDHLDKCMNLDFFSAAMLVPELACLGTNLEEIKTLGPEADKKVASLSLMSSEQVSSTIYELLVGASSVRAGLDLTMIEEDKSKKVPEYRIGNLHGVPAVIECKRRRGLTDYELKEAALVEQLYIWGRSALRERGVYGSLEACFLVPLESVPVDEFIKLVNKAIAKVDHGDPIRANWGSLAFRSLPYRRSVTETRLYSPQFLEEVFGWNTDQDEWDGIVCEVEAPSRVDVELFSMPLCLKWRSESAEALLKKARGIKSLWVDAIQQIPDGEMGFIYVAYPEGSRAAIADTRTKQILKELNEVWHRWSVRAPATVVSRLYARALGAGLPDLIENVLLAATEGEEFWLTKLPQRVFT
jgi:DNA-binding transcriptional MerR regulator